MNSRDRLIHQVLIVDDEPGYRDMLALHLTRAGYQVETAAGGREALELLSSLSVDLILSDVIMPEMSGLDLLDELDHRGIFTPVIVMSAYGNLETAIEAMKRGAYDYVPKPAHKDELLLTITKLEERERLKRTVVDLRLQLEKTGGCGKLIGRSSAMQEVFRLIEKVAPFSTTVLITGESGTGKEMVARELHRVSGRRDFVAVNCGAIPAQLLESELFGHTRGSFTDARTDRTGLFQSADQGTLLLDEVSELPPELQVKLLRVLQEGEIRRVGDNRPIKVDVRVIAATGRDLDEMVRQGTFRTDLYYRLNVVQLRIKPLRERLEDIPLLVDHFIIKLNNRLGTTISTIERETIRKMLAYAWPGNVRELENVVERAAVMAEGETITPDLLPPAIKNAKAASLDLAEPADLSIKRAVRQLEERNIRQALQKTSGNRTAAARLLEISQRALLYKIKEYEIDIPIRG